MENYIVQIVARASHENEATQFVTAEQWDSVDDRMLFSKNVQSARTKGLIPQLLPDHSHEFFEEVSCD